MDEREYTVPTRNRDGYYASFKHYLWTPDGLKDSPTAYPVSGDDIARWRAENG